MSPKHTLPARQCLLINAERENEVSWCFFLLSESPLKEEESFNYHTYAAEGRYSDLK